MCVLPLSLNMQLEVQGRCGKSGVLKYSDLLNTMRPLSGTTEHLLGWSLSNFDKILDYDQKAFKKKKERKRATGDSSPKHRGKQERPSGSYREEILG